MGRFPRKRDMAIGRGTPETDPRPSRRTPSGDWRTGPRRLASSRMDPMGGVGSGPPAAVPHRSDPTPAAGTRPKRPADLRRSAAVHGPDRPRTGRDASPGRKADRAPSGGRTAVHAGGGTGPRGGSTTFRRPGPARVLGGSAPDPHTGPARQRRKPPRAKAAQATARKRASRKGRLTDPGAPEPGPRGRRTGTGDASRRRAMGRPPCLQENGRRPAARPAGRGGRTGPSQHSSGWTAQAGRTGECTRLRGLLDGPRAAASCRSAPHLGLGDAPPGRRDLAIRWLRAIR